MRRQADFAEMNAEQCPPLVQSLHNAFSFNFVFVGNSVKLQKIIDTWLNKPCNNKIKFDLLAPYVIVTIVDNQNGFAEKHLETNFGYTRYLEVVFTLMVSKRMGLFEKKSLPYSFVPYIFLDHSGPVVCGREFIGMPKVFGKVGFPDVHRKDSRGIWNCIVPGIHDPFGPDARYRDAELFRISAREEMNFSVFRAENKAELNSEELVKGIYSGSSTSGGMSMSSAKYYSSFFTMPFVTMRQYRDFLRPNKAFYQVLMTYAASNPVVHRGGVLPGRFEIEFPEKSSSFPLADDLGLSPFAVSAWWMEWNFDFAPGQTLWKAGL